MAKLPLSAAGCSGIPRGRFGPFGVRPVHRIGRRVLGQRASLLCLEIALGMKHAVPYKLGRFGAWWLSALWLACWPVTALAQPQLTPAAPDPAEQSASAGGSLPAHRLAGRMVFDVRVAGNQDVPLEKIVPHIQTRPNRPYDPARVQEDIRRLNRTRWFITVESETRLLPQGVVVIFKVVERPRLKYVKYYGNRKVSRRVLDEQSELKPGDPLDPYSVEEARRKIEEYYHKKGFQQVRVTVLEGNKLGDRGAVFLIHEGPVQRVWAVKFHGNTVASAGRLKTQIQTKRPLLWVFGGFFEPQKVEQDVDALIDYYRRLGFFRARVSRELEFSEDGSWVTVHFFIYEGPRYKIRRVHFVGNRLFRGEDLLQELKLRSGEAFDKAKMDLDIKKLQEVYGSYGYIFAKIDAEPRFVDDRPELDLVYAIEEGKRWRVGRIEVQIKGELPHTHMRTVLNRLSLRPGDIVDIRKIRASERRLRASMLFENDPIRGRVPRILIRPMKEDEQVAEGAHRHFRGQSPEGQAEAPAVITIQGDWRPGRDEGERAAPASHAPASKASPGTSDSGSWHWRSGNARPPVRPVSFRQASAGSQPPGDPSSAKGQRRDGELLLAQVPYQPFGGRGNATPQPPGGGVFSTPPATAPPGAGPGNNTSAPSAPAGSSGAASGAPPAGNLLPPPGSVPPAAAPGAGASGPFAPPPAPATATPPSPSGGKSGGLLLPPVGAPPGQSDIQPGVTAPPEEDPRVILIPQVHEARTGRFSFGAGVNSNAGVVAQIVLDEQNFDITRWPRSWEEVIDGTAWRGAGQRFRLEAVPGSVLQRYMVRFAEPFLFDTPVSFSTSGYLYSRRFEDWDEQRLGGTITLGYQIRPDVSVSAGFRGESVKLFRARTPTPAQVAAVLGDTDLFTLELGLAYDTRDNAFLPTEGHLFQLGFIQGVGEFDYPRFTADLRKYFLLYQRPDQSGRHVLGVRGRVGVTGSNTPVYEQFFAGGYNTIRGFDFRGASPVELGTTVGGDFMLLGSVEYLFPITADDGLRMVLFVDFGTVEESVSIDADYFRVAPGLGLRIAVPGMGAPIALDFAWAAAKAPTDDTRVFSFFVGFLR